MATITLAPGEVFEHTHLHDSSTTVIAGTVEITFGGTRHVLAEGQASVVPGGQQHVLRNLGVTDAAVSCGRHYA